MCIAMDKGQCNIINQYQGSGFRGFKYMPLAVYFSYSNCAQNRPLGEQIIQVIVISKTETDRLRGESW